MTRKMLLMFKDIPVMGIDFDNVIYEVYRGDLLPYTLKGRLREPYPEKSSYTKYDIIQMQIISDKNKEAVISWLANRTLLLSRTNAKKIYNLFNVQQSDNPFVKARFAITCRAVSVLDPYWVKLEGDSTTWKNVNPTYNPLNEIVAQVALHGKAITLQGSLVTPEVTTHGAYAKAWRRHDDGNLWLHKLGANGNTESRIEVMCSKLLDKMNVEHVHYEEGTDEDKYVCMCPCITSDNMMILPGIEFVSWCNVNGLNPDELMLQIDADNIYKMWIVDYLISNPDRHGENWGFFCETTDDSIIGIQKCHPLWDHNNAFDIEYMRNKDVRYLFCDLTAKQAALRAISKVDFHFTDPIERSDFITERQYESFKDRAADLGLSLSSYKPVSNDPLSSLLASASIH